MSRLSKRPPIRGVTLRIERPNTNRLPLLLRHDSHHGLRKEDLSVIPHLIIHLENDRRTSPDIPLDLISKDFLYEARVWFEKKTDSICNGCARGCNIEVQTLHNKIKRLVPRHNPKVNAYWMCDHGRYDTEYVLGPRRWLRYRLGDSAAPARAATFIHEGLAAVVRDHGPTAVAGRIAPLNR